MERNVKRLHAILPKRSGRDSTGQVSARHRGGRHKRYYRIIDWRRDKDGVPARVVSIEYDPNRSADVALLQYRDGEKRYILAPEDLSIGAIVSSGPGAEIKTGNCLRLADMPVGTVVHNIEMKPGAGAQLCRSAGASATVVAVEGDRVQLKLPSGEIRIFPGSCRATVGRIGNADWKNRVVGKAGRSRHRGIRPKVRGVAQNPRSHPHGGGEGRSGIGLPSPKSRWGKRTLGKRTRKKTKYSDKLILQRRTH